MATSPERECPPYSNNKQQKDMKGKIRCIKCCRSKTSTCGSLSKQVLQSVSVVKTCSNPISRFPILWHQRSIQYRVLRRV